MQVGKEITKGDVASSKHRKNERFFLATAQTINSSSDNVAHKSQIHREKTRGRGCFFEILQTHFLQVFFLLGPF